MFDKTLKTSEFKVRSKGKKLHILKKIGFNEENKSFIIQCIASNQMGAASKSTSITVISTPSIECFFNIICGLITIKIIFVKK